MQYSVVFVIHVKCNVRTTSWPLIEDLILSFHESKMRSKKTIIGRKKEKKVNKNSTHKINSAPQ